MTDALLANMGLLGSADATDDDRSRVAAELLPLVNAIRAGIVAPMTALEWGALSDLTREALDLAITMEPETDVSAEIHNTLADGMAEIRGSGG